MLPSDNGFLYTEGDLATSCLGVGCVERCMGNILQGDSSVLPVVAVMNGLPC